MPPVAPRLDPRPRLLMGPGPSPVHPRVLQALAAPTLGHLDPQFIGYMDDVKAMLRQLFGTANAMTFPISGTGSAGMEACLVNVLEPGDRMVVGVAGVFGGRMAEVARRLGCEVVRVEVPYGEAIDPQHIEKAIAGQSTKLVAVVHGETSTGVLQPLSDIAAIAHRVDALCLADCVTSLGGVEVTLDAWGVDLAYAGTQKCLSCPPGLAPITMNDRTLEVIRKRHSPCSSWYLDVGLLMNYWSGDRAYHHTAPVNMIYALREALCVVLEEGLEDVHARHRQQHQALVTGLEALGLSMHVTEPLRLPQLNTVQVPDGIDEAAVRRILLQDYELEIGGGLGTLAGRVWRIGLMGHGARRANVTYCLAALGAVLDRAQGTT